MVLGVEGCPVTLPGGTGGGTTAGKGLNSEIVSGVGYISSGKEVSLGESLYVKVHLENYDKQSHSGQICIRDDIADAYGGIPKDECKSFSIKNAETIGVSGKEQLQSAKADVQFPETEGYSYHDIPILQAAKLFVDLKYADSSKITGVLNVPDPETEKLSLVQDSAVLKIDAEKTIRKMAEGYSVELQITIQKIMADAKIYSPDFTRENFLLIGLSPLDFKCNLGIENGLEFENTKFIRCSALVSEETQTAYPLVISLNYGAKISKSYNFNIKI